jgi:hypothetical protein
MPNGNHNFYNEELPKLEKFFGHFSEELEDFARRHNLLIDRYWHQFHSWRFSFKHPKGGIANLELFKETESLVKIYSNWWLDDYDKFTRFARQSQTDLFEAKKETIILKLEENFAEILSWNLNEWTDIGNQFENIWNRWSKEEFYNFNNKYPFPKF